MSARKPCWMRVLSLCFFLFFTFWVTSWKSAREASTSRLLCFTTGFPGSPMGLPPQHFSFSSNPCIGPVKQERPPDSKWRPPGSSPVAWLWNHFSRAYCQRLSSFLRTKWFWLSHRGTTSFYFDAQDFLHYEGGSGREL